MARTRSIKAAARLALIALAAMVCGRAYAQDAVDPLVLKAVPKERVVSFVRTVTQLSPGGQVSKRGAKLCPLVAGADPAANSYVRARLRQVAGELGLGIEKRACEPDVLVIFSREPDTMLRQARERGKIRYDGLSPVRIDRFKNDPKPIRWLSRTREIPVFGDMSAGDTDIVIRRAPDSHIVQPVVSRLSHTLIVIDARQADGIEIGALADYVTMVALADIRPNVTPVDATSILNLFAPGAEASPRLSSFDLAYLRAVYQMKTERMVADQLSALAGAMSGDLRR